MVIKNDGDLFVMTVKHDKQIIKCTKITVKLLHSQHSTAERKKLFNGSTGYTHCTCSKAADTSHITANELSREADGCWHCLDTDVI